MTSFIKKQQFNYIKKCLFDLNNAFRNCVDRNIVETTKIITQEKILAFFDNLSEEEKEILNISKITEPLHINVYCLLPGKTTHLSATSAWKSCQPCDAPRKHFL